MPVMMRGPIVCQLCCEGLFMPVVMKGLYISCDKRTNCMPVVMREHIVIQL